VDPLPTTSSSLKITKSTSHASHDKSLGVNKSPFKAKKMHDKVSQAALLLQLREEFSHSVNDIKQKDALIERMIEEMIHKDDAINMLTEKIIRIRNEIETLTYEKNKRIDELVEQLLESEKQLDDLEEMNTIKEYKIGEVIRQMQNKMHFYQYKFKQKENECYYWKSKAGSESENAVNTEIFDQELQSFLMKDALKLDELNRDQVIMERDDTIAKLLLEIEHLKSTKKS